jgi:hypothetical protein
MEHKIKTYFDGKKIVVPKELEGHEATEITLILPELSETISSARKGLPLLDEMIDISKRLKGNYPEELAKNLDYYLHGRRKFEH